MQIPGRIANETVVAWPARNIRPLPTFDFFISPRWYNHAFHHAVGSILVAAKSPSNMDDTSSIGQASAAVAMANDAIDKARRAAASSRNKRNSVAQYDNMKVENNSPDLDLKNNDNAFHVLATLVTERLLPKLEASPDNTHYTLTAEDTAFFQKMLPYSVRRGFVDALRYRLQLLKVGVGSRNSTIGKLTMQCQMLGLDRDDLNALLDLSQSAGMSVSLHVLLHLLLFIMSS